MDRQKRAERRQRRSPDRQATKKTYSKPALRRLGTVSELTQTPNPYGK